MLTREIGTDVLLQGLINETVAAYDDPPGSRFRLAGPGIRLSSELALTLAMALHELSSNAARYGALSAPEGRINVEWRIENGSGQETDRMAIDWTETGGPAVAEPRRRGFGSELIERGLARQFGGTAELEFHDSGLRCRIVARLPHPREAQP